MEKYKRFLLVVLLTFVFSTFFVEGAKAEGPEFNEYRYQWQEHSLIRGNDWIGNTFYLSPNMDTSNFTISLQLRQSPTLIKELSSISILVNNTVVDSIRMDQLAATDTVTVQVPDHLIDSGSNTVAIKVFLKSTREKCEFNNEINWLVIEKGSSFGFHYQRADSTAISNIFENTYYSDGHRGELIITVPDNLSPANYSQMASLAALTGFMHKNKETGLRVKTASYSDLPDLDKETIIIGTPKQIKELNADLLTAQEWQQAEENGYIALRQIGANNHFIVITSTEAQLTTLCKTLQNMFSLNQLTAKDYVLDVNKLIAPKGFNTNPSLQALGYEGFAQIGSGVKSFDYYFTLPANKMLTADNKLSFSYDYSSLSGEEKGYVAVEINGDNLLTKELPANEEGGKLDFALPEKYFDNTGFNVALKFNLAPSIESCFVRNYDNVWVAMDSDNSSLSLKLKDREKYSLLNSQGLLQNDQGSLEGKILVDSFDHLALTSLCQISSYLGEVSQGVNGLLIHEPKNPAGSYGAIFALTTSPIIKEINENLIIPVTDQGDLAQPDLFMQNTPVVGALGVTLNNDQLVIMASDKDQLNNSMQKYTTGFGNNDAVILMGDEIIASFGSTASQVEEKLPFIKENYETILALLVLLAAAITIFIIYHRKVKL